MVYKLHNRVIAGLIALMFVVTSIGLATLIRASATDETGYKIDVVYNNDKSLATLQGKLEEVKPNIELGTIVDKDGVESSALDFTKEITENGEYSFTLKYSDYNDQKNPEREKEIKVKVDGIKEKVEEQPQQPTVQPSEQPNEQQTVQSSKQPSEQPSEQPQQNDEVDYTKNSEQNIKPAPRTANKISLDVLKAELERTNALLAQRANDIDASRIIFRKYYSENIIPTDQTFNFTGGQLNDETLSKITGAQIEGRIFDRAVFKDINSQTEYTISGIYPYGGRWYYTVGNVSDLEGNVGYELTGWDTKEFRVYYKVTSTEPKRVTIDGSFDQFEDIKLNGYTKTEIDRMGGLQVLPNEKVVVEFSRANRGPNVQVIVKNLSNNGNKYVFDTGAMQNSGMGERAWDKFTVATINNSTRYSGIFTVGEEDLRLDKWYYPWSSDTRNVGVNTVLGEISSSNQSGFSEFKFTKNGGQDRNIYNYVSYTPGGYQSSEYENYTGRGNADKTVDGRGYAVGQFNPGNELQFVTRTKVGAPGEYAYLPYYIDLYVYINSNWDTAQPTNHYRLFIPQWIDQSQTYNLDFGAQIIVDCNLFYLPNYDPTYMEQKFTITVRNMEHNFLMDLGHRSTVQEYFRTGTFQGIDKTRSTVETQYGPWELSDKTLFIWADGVNYRGYSESVGDYVDGEKFLFNVAIPYGYAKPTAKITWRGGGVEDLTLKSRSGDTYKYELKALRGTSGDGTSQNTSTLNFNSVPVNFKPVYKHGGNFYEVINAPNNEQNYTTERESTQYSPVNAINMSVKNLVPKSLSVETGNPSNGFFRGFDLWVKHTGDATGGGLNMQLQGPHDGLWHPDDIINIQDLYNQLRDEDRLLDGIGDYILEFNVVSGGLQNGNYIKAKYEVWTQKAFGYLDNNVSTNFTDTNNFNVDPKDVYAYKGATARLFGYEEYPEDPDSKLKYILNKNTANNIYKPEGYVEDSTTPFARLTYVSAVNLQIYVPSMGASGTNAIEWNTQKENTWYTAVNNFHHTVNITELLNGFNVGTKEGKEFSGWGLRYGTNSDNGSGMYISINNKTVFQASELSSINFYTICNSNPDIWQKLFNEQGILYLEPIWEEDIKTITLSDGRIAGYTLEGEKLNPTSEYLEISADFKYGDSVKGGTELEQIINNHLNNGKIKISLAKKDAVVQGRAENTIEWKSWYFGNDYASGITSAKFEKPTITGKQNGVFTVSFWIKKESGFSGEYEDGARYNLMVWSDKNITDVPQSVILEALGNSADQDNAYAYPAEIPRANLKTTFLYNMNIEGNATRTQDLTDNNQITVSFKYAINTTKYPDNTFTEAMLNQVKDANDIKYKIEKKNGDGWTTIKTNEGNPANNNELVVKANGIIDISHTIAESDIISMDNSAIKFTMWTDGNGSARPSITVNTNSLYNVTLANGDFTSPVTYQDETDDTFTLKATFKYNKNTPLTLADINMMFKQDNSYLKVALFRQTEAESQQHEWWLWHTNYLNNNPEEEKYINSVNVTLNDGVNKTFDVTYEIDLSSAQGKLDECDQSQFKIIAWTDKNGALTPGTYVEGDNKIGVEIPEKTVELNVLKKVTSTNTGATGGIDDPSSTVKYIRTNTDGADSKPRIIIESQFKYELNNSNMSASRLNSLIQNDKIKIAIYRQKSNETNQWYLWHSNVDDNNSAGGNILTPNVTNWDPNTKTFTLQYTIDIVRPDEFADNHKANFKVIAWTVANSSSFNHVPGNNYSLPEGIGTSVTAKTTQTFKLDKIVDNNTDNGTISEISQDIYYDTKGNAENDNGTITITSKFKYNSSSITTEEFAQLKRDNKIVVQLHKQDPGQTAWNLWGNNNGGTSRPEGEGGGNYPVSFGGISDIDTTNKTFTVTFTVTPDRLSINDTAKFKVACWTDENVVTGTNLGSTVPTYGGMVNVLYDLVYTSTELQQTVPTDQTIYEGVAYDITSNFQIKAHTVPNTYNETRIKNLVSQGKIKVALYKQDPGDNGSISKWLEGLDVNNSGNRLQSATVSVDQAGKTLKIVYQLNSGGTPSLDPQYNDGAIFHTYIQSKTSNEGDFTFNNNTLPTDPRLAKASTKMNMIYKVTSFGDGITEGKVTDVPGTVKHYNTDASRTFDVSATFKYNSNIAKNLAAIKNLLGMPSNNYQGRNDAELKIALFKQEGSAWEKWADNAGAASGKNVEIINITVDEAQKTFTIQYRIRSASAEDIATFDNNQFRVFAWTKVNGADLDHDNITANNGTGESQKAPTRTDTIKVIGSVKNLDGNYADVVPTTPTGAVEEQAFNVTGTFKYVNGGAYSEDTAEVKTALFKQETNESTWTLVSTQPNSARITPLASDPNQFTVTYTISAENNSPWHVNHKTKFRVIAWTQTNGIYDTISDSNQLINDVGSKVTATTNDVEVERRFSPVSTGSSPADSQNINLVTGNEVHSSVKDFNTSHLDNENINVNLAEQRLQFDVTAFKDSNPGEKIKDRWKTVNFNDNNVINGSNKNVTVTGTWSTNGLGQSLKTTQDKARLTAYFWGDRVKLKGTYSANNASNLSNIDIYIDGELQEKAFNVKHESQSQWENVVLFDSGYIGYKPYSENTSELHKIEIVTHVPDSTNDLFAVYLNGIEFVTDHYLGPDITDNTSNTAYENTENRSGRVFYDYSVAKPSTKATDKLNITVASKEKTHTLLDQVKFKITASNMKNGAAGEANPPVTSTHTQFNVYSKVLDTNKNLTGTEQTVDKLKDNTEITFDSYFIYDGKIDQPRLDDLVADGTIKAAYFKQDPDKKNNQGKFDKQIMRLWALYDTTLKKQEFFTGGITSMSFKVDDTIPGLTANQTGIKVSVERPSSTSQWDNNGYYKIFLWSSSNNPDGAIDLPNLVYAISPNEKEDSFLENSKGKIPYVLTTTKFVKQVFNQDGQLGDYPGDIENPPKTPIPMDQSFNLESKFNYDIFGLDKGKDIDYLLENNKLKIAVYKKNPDGEISSNKWELWAKSNGKNEDGTIKTIEYGGHDAKIDPFKITTDSANKTFTVTVPIINFNGSVSERYEKGARYRIYCWVEGHENGNKTGTVSVPQFMDFEETVNTPDNEKPSVVFKDIPSRTHIIEVTYNEPTYYVEVPKTVHLFENKGNFELNTIDKSSDYAGNQVDVKYKNIPGMTSAPNVNVKVQSNAVIYVNGTETTDQALKRDLRICDMDGVPLEGKTVGDKQMADVGTLKYNTEATRKLSFWMNALKSNLNDAHYSGTVSFLLENTTTSQTP